MLSKQSEYLKECRPKLKELVSILDPYFDYVSVLATDVTGINFSAGQRQRAIRDYPDGEQGFVVRVYKNGGYSEFSFNEFGDVNRTAEKIRKELDEQEKLLQTLGIEKYPTPLVREEPLVGEYAGEASEEIYSLDNEAILKKIQGISDELAKRDNIIEARVNYGVALNRKMFISRDRDLIQAYSTSIAAIMMLALKDGETQYNVVSDSGRFGPEILDRLVERIDPAYEDLMAMFDADPMVPGEYEIITTPEGAGLIAHEAFGHGLEMDMFVKDRAIAKYHMGEKLASSITDLYDGAQGGIRQTASYFFDDEGTICERTQILDKGYLKRGICDNLSAARLGVEPTGNGRRESFERKAYTRMTNTYFGTGTDSLEDMIASVKYGFFIDGMDSGMEDPKHWGIQCVMSRAKEIKDGKFTGRMFTPVVLTGYVPDLLSNITMLGTDLALNGNGHCGKGYKEWVVVSDGGPYIKTKVRLG